MQFVTACFSVFMQTNEMCHIVHYSGPSLLLLFLIHQHKATGVKVEAKQNVNRYIGALFGGHICGRRLHLLFEDLLFVNIINKSY